MTTPSARLLTAVSAVCPADSARIGRIDDRNTWSFDPGADATQQQINAGRSVLQTIAVDELTREEPKPVQDYSPPVADQQLAVRINALESALEASRKEAVETKAAIAALLQSIQAASQPGG